MQRVITSAHKTQPLSADRQPRQCNFKW